jgi:hypothetical protein
VFGPRLCEYLFRKDQAKTVHFGPASEGYKASPSPENADCAEPVKKVFPASALTVPERSAKVENRN